MAIDLGPAKIATGKATIDNSSGTADLTQDAEILLGELKEVHTVVGLYVVGTATINSVAVSGNKVTVNATVPAGKTAEIHVAALGY